MSAREKKDITREKPDSKKIEPDIDSIRGGIDEAADPDQMKKADRGKTEDTDYDMPGYSGWPEKKEK
jgi:hypothetical protein